MGAVFLLQAIALNLQQVNSFRKGKARWRGRWGTIPGGFFGVSRNGLRPRPEDPDIPVTWQLHGGYMRGGAFRGSKRKGQWSKWALQIVLFVGFVEKR